MTKVTLAFVQDCYNQVLGYLLSLLHLDTHSGAAPQDYYRYIQDIPG